MLLAQFDERCCRHAQCGSRIRVHVVEPGGSSQLTQPDAGLPNDVVVICLHGRTRKGPGRTGATGPCRRGLPRGGPLHRFCFSHAFSAGFPTSAWKWAAQYSVDAVIVRMLQPLIAHGLPRCRLLTASLFFLCLRVTTDAPPPSRDSRPSASQSPAHRGAFCATKRAHLSFSM